MSNIKNANLEEPTLNLEKRKLPVDNLLLSYAYRCYRKIFQSIVISKVIIEQQTDKKIEWKLETNVKEYRYIQSDEYISTIKNDNI